MHKIKPTLKSGLLSYFSLLCLEGPYEAVILTVVFVKKDNILSEVLGKLSTVLVNRSNVLHFVGTIPSIPEV
jgi:hypothetical protein